MIGAERVLKLRSLNFGTRMNSQICIPMTLMNWNKIFPTRFFRKYRARSTMMKMNCINNVIKKVTGILFSSKYD